MAQRQIGTNTDPATCGHPRVRQISKRQDPLKHRMEHSRFVTDDIFRLCARTFQRRSGNAPDLSRNKHCKSLFLNERLPRNGVEKLIRTSRCSVP